MNNQTGGDQASKCLKIKTKDETSKKKKKNPNNPESFENKDKKSIDSERNNSAGLISRCQETGEEEEETKICKSRFENIRIEKFLETIKYSKKTIVYEIKCTYKGKMHSVKRSFREFGALNSAVKQKYKDKKMPQFPQKKAQNSILTFNDLEERKKLLGVYL